MNNENLYFLSKELQFKRRETVKTLEEIEGKKCRVSIETTFSGIISPKRKTEPTEPETIEETLFENIESSLELATNLSLKSDGFGNYYIEDTSFGKNGNSDYRFLINEKEVKKTGNNPKLNLESVYKMGSTEFTIEPMRKKRSGIVSIKIAFELPSP